jgi:hypothetical protein
MTINITICYVVMTFSMVTSFQNNLLHPSSDPEDGGSSLLRNADNDLPGYKVACHRIQQSPITFLFSVYRVRPQACSNSELASETMYLLDHW